MFTRVRNWVSSRAWAGRSEKEPPFTMMESLSPSNAVHVISQTFPQRSTQPLGAVPSR